MEDREPGARVCVYCVLDTSEKRKPSKNVCTHVRSVSQQFKPTLDVLNTQKRQFCKSCVYKYFEENEDCPRCGRDLRPDPYITIREDLTIQRVVDKVVPEIVEQDKELEALYYKEKGIVNPSLPDPDKMDTEEPIVD